MAKTGKKKASTATPAESAPKGDPLETAFALLAEGDYARAKVILREKGSDAQLPDGVRAEARERLEAVSIERGTLWVGLACVGLLVLVILVTVFSMRSAGA